MYNISSSIIYSNSTGDLPEIPIGRHKDGNLFSSPRLHNDHDRYILRIPVPGMTRKDIQLHVEGSKMIVSGNKKMEGDESILHHTFLLPADATIGDVKARCRNGLLTIEIRRQNRKTNHRVIKVEGEDERKILMPSASWWKSLKQKIIRVLN
jgi:hypothetical protein